MKTFEDEAGRKWTLAVHVTAIKQVRAALDIDLLALIENKFAGLADLLSDPVTLVDVIYVLCKDQADRQGITDAGFGAAMAGDAIERAAIAFMDAYSDFFRDPRIRTGLKQMTEATRRIEDRMANLLEKEVGRVIAETEGKTDAELLTLIASSGSVPASSDSTPAHSLSGN